MKRMYLLVEQGVSFADKTEESSMVFVLSLTESGSVVIKAAWFVHATYLECN
jgi:hypothetical protein